MPFYYLITLMIFLLVNIETANAQLADSPWPMYKCNPQHTGLSSYDTSRTKPIEKWRFETDGGVESSVVIGPDGTLYVGGYHNHLYAINPDGTEKWRFATGPIVASPSIDKNGTIYVGSWSNYVYAIGGPNICPVNVVLEGDKEYSSILSILTIIRDEIFAKSWVGRHWTQLYYRHNAEAVSLLVSEESLRLETRDILKKFAPIFRIMLWKDSVNENAILTYDQVAAFNALMIKLAARGSAQMSNDIISEMERLNLMQYIGQDIRRVWKSIEANTKKQLEKQFH